MVVDLAQVQPQPAGLDAFHEGAAVEVAATAKEPLARCRRVVAHGEDLDAFARKAIDQSDQRFVGEQVAFVEPVIEQQIVAREPPRVFGCPVEERIHQRPPLLFRSAWP